MLKAAGIVATVAAIVMVPAAVAHPLEKGLVVSDPYVLQVLDEGRYGFRVFVGPRLESSPCAHGSDGPTANNLFENAPLCDVAKVLAAHVKEAKAHSLDPTAKANSDSKNLFPANYFTDNDATLTLVGIVNRMDRAYRPSRTPGETQRDTCGEIRFIYRFGYREAWPATADRQQTVIVSSRLPLTLNLVLRARRGPQQAQTCADIARRWLDFAKIQRDDFVTTRTEAEPIARALDAEGPLALLTADHIDRIEVNMQTMRLPASDKQDFGTHAEYLLMVFKWDAANSRFVQGKLENQVHRTLNVDRAIAPATFESRLQELKAALLSPQGVTALDRGEILLDEKFLTDSAVSIAPGGHARSQNRPFDALLGYGPNCDSRQFICVDELAQALKAYQQAPIAKQRPLRTVKSVDGFVTRLNDLTCSGCHQTRGVAGFHFTGADLPSKFSANDVYVPGSPHFFGDLPRRRKIVEAIAAGADLKAVDFSRGFSARPEPRFSAALANTKLLNGWGATCHIDAGLPGADPSFANWNCGPQLRCRVVLRSEREPKRGMCLSAGLRQIGDPIEGGDVTSEAYGVDRYTRTSPNRAPSQPEQTSFHYDDGRPLPELMLPAGRPANSPYRAAQQLWWAPTETGGFPAGNLRTDCCNKLPGEASCGMVAVDGFNACLRDLKRPLTECFDRFTNYAGLRACDAATPCRDDYICLRPILNPSESAKAGYAQLTGLSRQYKCTTPDDSWLKRARMGTCIPPYFVIQFRADKHHRMPGAESGKGH